MLATKGTAIMTPTAAPTADTAATDDIEAVFEGDEKTSEALVPVLASLKAMLDNSDEKALSIASQAVWIASRDGKSILRAPGWVLVPALNTELLQNHGGFQSANRASSASSRA